MSAPARPNILLVTIDTLRPDRVQRRLTPTLDALAEAGLRFTRARTAVPLTLPSHVTIMTGLLPNEHGVRKNGERLAPTVPTLAGRLQAAGYKTGAFVGAYVLDSRFGLARGFDRYDDRVRRNPESIERLEAERRGSEVVDAATAWLADVTTPFFLWVHLYDPHAPSEPPPEFRARAGGNPYDGEIAYADAQVGRLLELVRKRGLESSTIVAAAGDHGEGLGEHGEDTHGMLAYDSTLHVPLILKGPGVSARTVVAPVTLVDLASSLLRRAGVPPAASEPLHQDLFGALSLESGYCRRDTISACCRMASSIGACRSAMEARDVFRARTVRPPRGSDRAEERCSRACTHRQRHAGEIAAVERKRVYSVIVGAIAGSRRSASSSRLCFVVGDRYDPESWGRKSSLADRGLVRVRTRPRARECEPGCRGTWPATRAGHAASGRPRVQLDICSRTQGRGPRGRGCCRVSTRRRTMAPGPGRFPRSGGRRARGWRHSLRRFAPRRRRSRSTRTIRRHSTAKACCWSIRVSRWRPPHRSNVRRRAILRTRPIGRTLETPVESDRILPPPSQHTEERWKPTPHIQMPRMGSGCCSSNRGGQRTRFHGSSGLSSIPPSSTKLSSISELRTRRVETAKRPGQPIVACSQARHRASLANVVPPPIC